MLVGMLVMSVAAPTSAAPITPRHAPSESTQGGASDQQRPLLVAPVLSYSTFLGSTSSSSGVSSAVDRLGNAYVTGQTDGSGFPTPPGGGWSLPLGSTGPSFLVKISPTGRLLWTTFFGGRDTFCSAVAVDRSGNIYVAGNTSAPDFPTTRGALHTRYSGGPSAPFVVKLAPSGRKLLYSTFLGRPAGAQGAVFTVHSMAVDPAGRVYLAGDANGPGLPTTPGALQPQFHGGNDASYGDAYVVALDAGGDALVYATYLGGKGSDTARGIAVDQAGDAFVAGTTYSPDFPLVHPIQRRYAGTGDAGVGGDAFVVKLSADGTKLLYGTYLGGNEDDAGRSIAVDAAGAAFIAGATLSLDFPQDHPLQHSFGGAFVAKVSPDGRRLVFSTYLGSAFGDDARAIIVDAAGNAYMTGATQGGNGPPNPGHGFPLLHPVQATVGGAIDAFVTEINGDGHSLIYSTYLGGSFTDDGLGIGVDAAGNAYVMGTTFSADFPMRYPVQGAYPQTFEVGACYDKNYCHLAGETFVARIGAPLPHIATPADKVRPACCGAHFFKQTGHNLSGPFLAFWQKYGGLDIFGYPRTEPFAENGHLVQYTDRFEMILANGKIRTAPLGRLLTASRSFPHVAPFASTAARIYVTATGHSLSGGFLAFWRAHQGTTLLGAPLDEETIEFNEDRSGRLYTVQWFEKGRLEYHSEASHTRYEMQLGLVGKEALQRRGWLP